MKKSLLFLGLFFVLSAVYASAPDFIIVSVSYNSNQTQYQKFNATITVKNNSAQSTSAFSVTEAYFSKDDQWDQDDKAAGFISFRGLEAGQSVTMNISGGANQFGIDAGQEYKYLIVRADYRQEITESNENNNIWVGPINITNGEVDLKVGTFQPSTLQTVRQGSLLTVNLEIVNQGREQIPSVWYDYFLSEDDQIDETDKKWDYNYIGMDWTPRKTATNWLGLDASIPVGYYNLLVRVNNRGQEITYNDVDMSNNVQKLFSIYVSPALRDSVLSFNEAFGTTEWEEDGYKWKWRNGLDNIRDYTPYQGTGHAMAGPGNGAILSTNSLIDVKGLWVRIENANALDSLKIVGYDKDSQIKYSKKLDITRFYKHHAYLTLDWKAVRGIQFQTFVKPTPNYGPPPHIKYDEMDYTYLGTPSVNVSCIQDRSICGKSALPDYRSLVTYTNQLGTVKLTQEPAPGTIIDTKTLVKITVQDEVDNQSTCSFMVAPQKSDSTFAVSSCGSYTFNGKTYTESGLYKQMVINAAGCEIEHTIELTIKDIEAKVTIADSVLFVNEVSGASYQWLLCNNEKMETISEATTASYTPATSGRYAVRVTGSRCEKISACVSFNSKPPESVVLPPATAYPNPGTGVFTLKSEYVLQDAVVKVFSPLGHQVWFANHIKGKGITIDLSEVPSGIYYIEISDNNYSQRVRWIKQ